MCVITCILQLDAQEVDARCQVLKDLEDAINAKWAHLAVVIRPFGSFPAGLSTFLSDIDISILGPDTTVSDDTEELDSKDNVLGEANKRQRVTIVLDSDGEEIDDDMEEGDDSSVSWTIDRSKGIDESKEVIGSRSGSAKQSDSEWSDDDEGDNDDMNDCGGLDIHISSERDSQQNSAQKRKRVGAGGPSKSPSRELQLGMYTTNM